MKKSMVFVMVALLAVMVLAQEQEQEPVPTAGEQAQAVPQPPTAAPAPQGRDLKRVRFPLAFIHAGKEYAAGDYWLILGEKESQPVFFVRNAQEEVLFEELAVVKPRSGGRSGRGFAVNKQMTKDGEYFRVKVTTAAEWLMGYFLVKK